MVNFREKMALDDVERLDDDKKQELEDDISSDEPENEWGKLIRSDIHDDISNFHLKHKTIW